MDIRENVPLREYSTMRLGGTARYVLEITSQDQIESAVSWADNHDVPVLMVGGGSNIVWRDEGFAGLLLINKILGYDEAPQDDGSVLVHIGGGEDWDSVVERTVASGLTGIETLSLIPGTAGATPVQNVGAYGQEIKDTLVSVEAFDLQTKEPVRIAGEECQFGYRTSRFKTVDRGRFLITGITLKLQKGNPEPPFYRAVEEYFSAHNITQYTPKVVRDAVIDIRSHKLPDPSKAANNGSFFANPLVDRAQLDDILAAYPDVPHWDTAAEGVFKVPAAWLIEHAGFKDYHDADTGMATWPTQPLVLVNEHAASTEDLLEFKQKITSAVHAKFGITLTQEPELLP